MMMQASFLLPFFGVSHQPLLWMIGAVTLVGAVAFASWLFRWPFQNATIRPVRASKFSPQALVELLADKNRPYFDVIVVGSGSGGCACANMLAQSGERVLVLEQHPTATGGCTHSFREEGCEWDTGLHYTSASMGSPTCRPGALMRFMTKGLQKWTLLDDPYDEILFPHDSTVKPGLPNRSSYRFVRGAENTVDSILADIDPDNKKLRDAALRYMDLCKDINGGFTALGLSRVLPGVLRFLVRGRVDRLRKFASMTVRDVQYAVFNLGYTKDELLQKGCPKAPDGPEPDPVLRRIKAVLTHPIGDYAVQPRDATMAAHGVTMAHYSDGACYSVGATQQISLRSTSLVRACGGEAFVDATVRSIVVENGRAVGVRVSNTSAMWACHDDEERQKVPAVEIRARRAVVWASGIYSLYGKMLPQDMEQVKAFHDPTKRSVRPSNGHIFVFCKIQGDAANIGLPTHNLWYFNSYDMDEAFDSYFRDPTGVRPPTVYIGFPCTKDVTWSKRFPGVSNCVMISDGLWEWFEKWEDTVVRNRGSPEYDRFKQALTDKLLEILYECVPQVKGKIEYHHLGTPLSEVSYLSSYHGGSYGTKCLTEMLQESNERWTTNPRTQIPGLYLAGSDAFLPAVCGAMYGGCFGAGAVLGSVRTLKLTLAFLSDFARSIQAENPKLTWLQAYWQAWDKFVNE